MQVRKEENMVAFTRRCGAGLIVFLLIRFGAIGQTEKDFVDGDLVTFNTNGVWCWFQDERAVVDIAKQKVVIGSVTNSGGIEAIIYDLAGKKVESKTQIGKLTTDDHNAPGFLILPNGHYLAMFADHYDKYNTHYCIYDGSKWSAEKKFDWQKIPGGTNYTIAYNNVYFLSAENKIYDFSRANNRSPNFLLSSDSGITWEFGGQISTDVTNSYNRGYYKYWGNGVDRIDFCCTEQHPRDYTTSIYHGYIKGGKCFASDGTLADSNIFDVKNMPVSHKNFTQVFANGTKVGGVSMVRCWESDIMRYEDGSIAILFKARADNSETDHRNFYSRYDGKAWKTTYIGKAGPKMYAAEEDYTGLGALCPNDPTTIYISSPFNPGDDNSKAGKREIWKGVTSDLGATWKWTAVTANSSKDNFRPIVPAWNKDNTALLWFRGTYTAAQQFSASVVGVFYQNSSSAVKNTRGGSNSTRNGFLNVNYSYSSSKTVTIDYSLSENTMVDLQVFSLSGKKTATLFMGENTRGVHSAFLPVGKLKPGMYLCRMKTGSFSEVNKFRVW
jgi:hypothetical protein